MEVVCSFMEVYTHRCSSPNPLYMALDPRSCEGKDWENKLEVTKGMNGEGS